MLWDKIFSLILRICQAWFPLNFTGFAIWIFTRGENSLIAMILKFMTLDFSIDHCDTGFCHHGIFALKTHLAQCTATEDGYSA